jgi:outer membrane protein
MRTRLAVLLGVALAPLLALLPLVAAQAQEARVAEAQQVPATGPLTLSAAIELALSRQPQLSVASANKDASAQRLKQVKASYLPTVTPTYNYQSQYTFGKVQVFQGNGVITELPSGRTTTTRQEQISLNYRLFDSGRRDLNTRQARQNLGVTELTEENTRQGVIGNVADTYFSALRTDALVRVSEAQVERARQTYEQIKFQASDAVGTTPKKDILQAEADYLNAKVNLLQAQNNAEIAHTQLRNSMGLTGYGKFSLADVAPPSLTTPMTAQVEGITLDTKDSEAITRLVTLAQEKRPDILQSELSAAASQTAVKLAELSARPVLNVDVSAGYQLDAANDPTRQIGNNRALVANITYPLFDGGAARANIHASEATQRSSLAQVQNQKQQVALEVEQAWRNFGQARVSIPATEAARAAAQKNYEAASEALKLGAGSTVEVITAQTSLVQAEINYVQALYNFYTTDARLTRVLGQAERIGRTAQK